MGGSDTVYNLYFVTSMYFQSIFLHNLYYQDC
jgi:hypothetical protein